MCRAVLSCVCYFYEIQLIFRSNLNIMSRFRRSIYCEGKVQKNYSMSSHHPHIHLTSRKRSTVSVTADHNHLVWKGKVDINDIAVR